MCRRKVSAVEEVELVEEVGAAGMTGTVEVWSHRGRVDGWPQFVDNTTGAVANALSCGADGVEVDTWLSADGLFVMTHDRDTPAGPVDRCTEAALDRFDRLEDVFAAAGGATLNIELKVPPGSSPADQARLGEVLASYLGRRFVQSGAARTAVVVSSFSAVATHEILSIGLDVRVGHLCIDVPASQSLEDLARYGYWGIHFLATEDCLERVPTIRAAGLAAVAWTVNDPELASRLVEAGVDVIITDRPVAVRAGRSDGGSVALG